MFPKKSDLRKQAIAEVKPSEKMKGFKIEKPCKSVPVIESDDVNPDNVAESSANSRRRLSVDIDRKAHYRLKCFAVYTGGSITTTLNNLIYTHCPIKLTA